MGGGRAVLDREFGPRTISHSLWARGLELVGFKHPLSQYPQSPLLKPQDLPCLTCHVSLLSHMHCPSPQPSTWAPHLHSELILNSSHV